MPSAAVFAAIAAGLSAVSTFISMLINRRTFLEAARPDLIVTEWARDGDTVNFFGIRNVGRGVAMHVMIYVDVNGEMEKATAIGGADRITVVPVDEKVEIEGFIHPMWGKVQKHPEHPALTELQLVLMYWDSRGRRHVTTYRIVISKPPTSIGGAQMVAPGVAVTSRQTRSRSVRLLKVQRWPRRQLDRGRHVIAKIRGRMSDKT